MSFQPQSCRCEQDKKLGTAEQSRARASKISIFVGKGYVTYNKSCANDTGPVVPRREAYRRVYCAPAIPMQMRLFVSLY